MKWIIISVICLFMIASLAICQEITGQRLNLEIVPPLKTPPASLNEISKYDTTDDKFISDTIGEYNNNDDDIAKLDIPLEDEAHINEDKYINKKLKLEDYKFNPYVKIDEDTDGIESEEYNNRAIFLARFLDPENLKYLRARIRRSAEPQQQNPSASEINSKNNGGKQESAPVPDDDEKADRFLNT